MGSDRRLAWRGGIALRTAAAIPGGYTLTAGIVALLARSLPMSRLDAAEAATMASFVVFAALVVAAFGVRRLTVLLTGLAVAGATVALALLLVPARP